MIEPRNLFKLQSKLSKKDKSIPVKTLEKSYILSWILIGFFKSGFYKKVAFKGGTALKKIYFPGYRFSEDLDFTALDILDENIIRDELKDVFDIILDDANIETAIKNYEIHKNGYTFYINYSGPLGAALERGEVKTDFTVNEKLMYKPIHKNLLREYEEYTDIGGNFKLKVYPLEEIFLEKFLSILSKSRTEPRDLYDLWYLISNKCVNFETMKKNIEEKGKTKGIGSLNIIDSLEKKSKNYMKLWQTRLVHHMVDLPHFNYVYRELKRKLKKFK